jgi:hypothetical protein
MTNVDLQVELRIIELAWQMLDKHISQSTPRDGSGEFQIKTWTGNFDKVYKELIKTVSSD